MKRSLKGTRTLLRPTRRAMLAGGSVLSAAALVLGAAPASYAAATPSAGWHDFQPELSTVVGISAPAVNDAWAGGEYGGDSGYMHFDGTGWTRVLGPEIGPVGDVSATSADDMWAIGTTTTAHYNGTSWTTSALVIPSGLTAVPAIPDGFPYPLAPDQIFAVSASEAFATVLLTNSANSVSFQDLEQFTGGRWSMVTGAPDISETSSVKEITGTGADDVYAVVLYNGGQDDAIDHFNGHAWSAEKLPGSPFNLTLAVTGAGTALALGGDSYAAQLSGGTWRQVSLPSGQAPVMAGASGSGAAYVEMASGELWKYDGGTWTQLTPSPDVAASFPLAGVTSGGGLWTFDDEVDSADTSLLVG